MIALIVDDHPLARRGLAAIVREGLRVSEILEADAPAVALTLARARQPDLVLADMHLADSVPARELVQQLRAALPRTKIVLVTAFDRVAEIRDCLQAGANGCLLKDTAELDLAAALRAMLDGQTFIDPRIAQKLALELVAAPGDGGVHLTPREREVLALLAEGCSNRVIGERLTISETTVKGYVSSLLEKLDARSRLEAVAHASKAGLL
jgi:DNA-binding NarL/FixJ family response regulator